MDMDHAAHLTIPEAVRISGIRRTKLYELLGEGQIEAVKLGRRTLVKSTSLCAFMAQLPQFGEVRR